LINPDHVPAFAKTALTLSAAAVEKCLMGIIPSGC